MKAGMIKFTSQMMKTAMGMANRGEPIAGNSSNANCQRTPISMKEKVGTMDSQSNITETLIANTRSSVVIPVKQKTIRY